MKTTMALIQIFLSLILTALIFLQSSGDSDGRSNLLSVVRFEKRGWEKILFNFTIIVLILFLISSIVQVVI